MPEELQDEESRLERLEEATEKLEEKVQELTEEQVEKIRQPEQEEEETGTKKRGRKPTPPEQTDLPDDTKANTTDPESRTLKTRNGWVQGYNCQAMVDCEKQILVAQDITTDANDVQQLAPMMETCGEIRGKRPKKALADAGYWSQATAALADEEMELTIATTTDW